MDNQYCQSARTTATIPMRPFSHAFQLLLWSGGSSTRNAAENGFFAFRLGTRAARQWRALKLPRYTSKPERGRWAKNRAGWLNKSVHAVRRNGSGKHEASETELSYGRACFALKSTRKHVSLKGQARMRLSSDGELVNSGTGIHAALRLSESCFFQLGNRLPADRGRGVFAHLCGHARIAPAFCLAEGFRLFAD